MEIIIILLLILLNGVFAMSEVALISARKSNLLAQAKQGNKQAARALRLAEDPDKFLSTVQIGITLIGILTGIYSGATLAEDFGKVLARTGIPLSAAQPIAQTLIVVVVTYVTIIFGELVPKRIGLTASEKMAKLISGPMKFLSVIASPFVWLLSKSTSGIFGLLRLKDGDAKVTEAEIKSIIREGAEDGEVQPVEEDIVTRVFSLGDRDVETIMTHRSDIDWMDVSWTADEIRRYVREHPHSLYPVAEGSLDGMVGIVLLKDLFGRLSAPDFRLAQVVRPELPLHENMPVYKALSLLRDRETGYGFIYDEFGTLQGMITLKDILEALVGEIPEEHEEREIVIRDDGSRLIDGQCSYYDFLEHYGLEELYSRSEFNTLGGLILDRLGHIPETGEKLQWKNFTFEVVDMDGPRIDKVLVTRDGEAE